MWSELLLSKKYLTLWLGLLVFIAVYFNPAVLAQVSVTDIVLGCAQTGASTWFSTTGQHWFYGTNANLSNICQCQTYCWADPRCVAFDWDTGTPNQCFTFTSNAAFYNSPGVNHYQKMMSPTTVMTTAYVYPTSPTQNTAGPSGYTTPIMPPPTTTTTVTGTSGPPAASQQASNFYATLPPVNEPEDVLVFGIKPAYIVLIGMGGGCISLVIIAIIIICDYPLAGAGTVVVKGKNKKNKRESIHTHQPQQMKETSVQMNEYNNGGSAVVDADPYSNSREMSEMRTVEENPAYNEDGKLAEEYD